MDEAIRDYVRGLAIVAALALVALAFVINPMPWSALGGTDQGERVGNIEGPAVDLSDFDMPDGWGPVLVPVDPGTPT